MAESVVIVGAKRTPIGSFQGQFASVTASQLGSVAIKAAMAEAGIEGSDVEDAHYGLCAARRSGSGPGAAGGAGRGFATVGALHHGE